MLASYSYIDNNRAKETKYVSLVVPEIITLSIKTRLRVLKGSRPFGRIIPIFELDDSNYYSFQLLRVICKQRHGQSG